MEGDRTEGMHLCTASRRCVSQPAGARAASARMPSCISQAGEGHGRRSGHSPESRRSTSDPRSEVLRRDSGGARARVGRGLGELPRSRTRGNHPAFEQFGGCHPRNAPRPRKPFERLVLAGPQLTANRSWHLIGSLGIPTGFCYSVQGRTAAILSGGDPILGNRARAASNSRYSPAWILFTALSSSASCWLIETASSCRSCHLSSHNWRVRR